MEPSKELEKVIESKFLTPQKFAIEIEKIVAQEDLNYIVFYKKIISTLKIIKTKYVLFASNDDFLIYKRI